MSDGLSDAPASARIVRRRIDKLDLVALKIVPAYVEAGYFSEAHCVTLSDGAGSMVSRR